MNKKSAPNVRYSKNLFSELCHHFLFPNNSYLWTKLLFTKTVITHNKILFNLLGTLKKAFYLVQNNIIITF